MNAASMCAWAQAAASLDLDARLPAAAQSRLRNHLVSCAECRVFATEVGNLHERIARIPERQAAADLAERVRARAHGDRSTRIPLALLQRIAAVLVAGFTLFAAYSLGRIEARRAAPTYVFEVPREIFDEPSPRLVAASDAAPRASAIDEGPSLAREAGAPPPDPKTVTPVTPAASAASVTSVAPAAPAVPVAPDLLVAQQESTRDATRSKPAVVPAVADSDDERRRLARAGRAVLADLAVIGELPAARRRPLLESQLRHFGLQQWAVDPARATAEEPADRGDPHALLARFVREMEAALSAEPESIVALGKDRRATRLFDVLDDFGPPREPPIARRSERRRIIEDVAADLTEAERDDLDELLGIKESWIEGSYAPALRLVASEGGVARDLDAMPFGAAFRTNVISALTEAGMTEWQPLPLAADAFPRRRSADSDRALSIGLDMLERARMAVGPGATGFVIKIEMTTIGK